MDVNVYRLIAPRAPGEGDTGRRDRARLWLSAEQLAKLRLRWPDLQAEQLAFFDSEKLAKDCDIPGNFVLDTWDLSIPRGWASYVDMDEKLPNRLVEVDSADYCGVKDEYEVAFEVNLTGYLRKPFRGAETAAVQAGDTLTLSVRNFSATVGDQLTTVLGEDAMGKAYALFTFEDRARLEALKPLCDDPAYWQQQVLDRMTDELCVTAIDW
jgi:hypothetical protein